MMSKNAETRCTVCVVKGHFKEKCWKVIGYPSWHPRGKENSQRKGGTNKQGQLYTSFGGRTSRLGFKVANQAEVAEQPVPGLTSQQIKLLKLLPTSSNSSSVSHSEETDEDIDHSYAGIAANFHAKKEPIDWVIDTGATDHMTSLSEYLHEIKHRNAKSCIKLPNGIQIPITQYGNVHLCNDLVLKDTLVVPTFKYNLLPASKFCKDNNCLAIFHEEICSFQDCATWKSDPASAMGDNAVSYSSEDTTPTGEPTSTTTVSPQTAVEQRHEAQLVRRSAQVKKTPTWMSDFVTQVTKSQNSSTLDMDNTPVGAVFESLSTQSDSE
ncbi:hypothetical protein Cgig2_013851 [Carnegiea gigantea]|uniref:Retrovirus-related Pol polyprotein from transposon TNT 1-94-like beta-barrel domain-containing protein n=1 Tax=Carnegiea gigantea TaxID=171969 RepID=A0A9Q1KKY6_9CARY|nr:hypothetical protein Cgig2_013851 [Carnegiea gigantea]